LGYTTDIVFREDWKKCQLFAPLAIALSISPGVFLISVNRYALEKNQDIGHPANIISLLTYDEQDFTGKTKKYMRTRP